jgi:hypothetical protein
MLSGSGLEVGNARLSGVVRSTNGVKKSNSRNNVV